MKLIKTIFLTGALTAALSLVSCAEWLDVNTDPENPTLESAEYQLELAHCEFYTNSAQQFAAWRSSMAMGDWTRNISGGTYWSMSFWAPADGITTTPYQWFLVGAGATLKDMYAKAMAAENWHYAGVAKVLLAYGYMLMTDLYGEMPYTQGLSESAIPEYDNGKTIYLGCLTDIDEAIDLLSRSIDTNKMPSLAVGDFWNNGDVNKWSKLANLLKARWINKLIKKGEGSYLEGKYDRQAILDCLSKAMTSNADNTVINHTDDNGTTHDDLGWNEPVDYSPLFSVCGMNSGYMATKMLYDNLTNFDGLGVEDPRADHILPWAKSKKSDAAPKEIKWNVNGTWRRTLGVDMSSNIFSTGGPLRASYGSDDAADKKGIRNGDFFWINSSSADRLGDTVYVESTSTSKGYHAKSSLIYRRNNNKEGSEESGSFYSRVSAPTYVGTYAEACFIKAEVLFNNGDKAGAYDAYKEGIKASIELMNEKLKVWVNEDASLASCPSFTPIAQADIDNFLANGIGSSGDLTLGRILTQKRIALLFSVEIWNDMRRYDFNRSLFLGWNIAAYHDVNAAASEAIPAGQYFRRWRQCSHELNYNTDNLQAIGNQVPGADMSYVRETDGKNCWNLKPDVWTINVWWDSDQQ